jgi:putative addiction module killer protein
MPSASLSQEERQLFEVDAQVDRLIHGNPGTYRNLTEGISELKVDVGPGYRVYHSKRGDRLLLLLAGGDKATQAKDIAKALELNRKFVESRS